jgi:putative methyltransferase (TIGR04325 family)
MPPVFWRFVAPRPNILRTVRYNTFAEARAACPEGAYEQEQLVEIIFRKTQIFREQCLHDSKTNQSFAGGPASAPLVTAMAALLGSGQNHWTVVDIGGACGAHYFAIRAFLPLEVKLRWIVVETPALVRRASELGNNELSFSSSLEHTLLQTPAPDLLHSSGTLQYVPEPYQMLRQISASGARYLVLTRLVMTDGQQDFAAIQRSRLGDNGPGPLPPGLANGWCQYPHHYLRRHAVEAELTGTHELLLQWNEGAAAFDSTPLEKRAYWLRRKSH